MVRYIINNLDLIKLKVCVKKRTLSKRERGSLDREREKSFTNSTHDIGIMSKIKEEAKKLYIKKTNNPNNDWYTYLYT